MLQARVQMCRGREAGDKGFSLSVPWSESRESWAKGLRPLGSQVSGQAIGLD